MGMHGIEEHAQLGLISRAGAPKSVNRIWLASRVRSGSLIAVHPGVYRFLGAPESWDTRALALAMYGGKDAALSHRSAAWLHQLEGFEEPKELELLVPHTVQIKLKGARIHRTREKIDAFKRRQIPTTSLARTLIDLAECVKPPELEIALNCAWRKQRNIAAWLRNFVENLSRTRPRGLDVLMDLVSRLDGRGLDNGYEVKAKRLIEEAALPAPTKGYVARDATRKHIMRTDLCWEAQRVVLHLDSVAFHRPEIAMARDARQRSELSLLNWTQIAVMARTLGDGVWLRQLREALSRPAGRAASPSAASPRAP